MNEVKKNMAMSFQMNIKTLHLIIVCAFGIITFLSSCSSSKTVRENDEYNTTITESIAKTKNEKELIKEAKKWLGTKYKYGGHSKSGTDCSGFVMQIYKSVYDIKLPRSSREQQEFCKKIKKSQLKIGDLVFFATGKKKGKVSHVGLYIGNGEFIHASSSKGVVISKLEQNYYIRTYHSSGRVKK